jgi:hypothetical protein
MAFNTGHNRKAARRRRRFFAGWRFVPGAERLEDRSLLSTFNEVEANGSFATANLVSVPTGDILTTAPADWLTISAAISVSGDNDYFQFTLTAAAGVFFDIDSQEIGLSTSLDSVLNIFNAGQTSAGSNDDGYDFEGFAVPATSTGDARSEDSSLYLDLAAGTYTARVTAVSGTGNYQLRILADVLYTATPPVLNSLPGATSDTLYLDFDGHASTTDSWPNYTAEAFDLNNNVSQYSPGERLAIKNTWRVVAEDYSPFNVNVSTVEPASLDNGLGFRQIMTSSLPSIINRDDGVLGIAFIGSYAGGGTTNNVAFTFAGNFGTYGSAASGRIVAAAVEIGNTTSHEFGHALGLDHYNSNTPPTSFAGNATRIPNAIMATPDQGISREIWAAGQADLDGVATFAQDDVAVISNATNTFGYRSDDYPGTSPNGAQPLTASGSTYTASGIIEQLTDVDFFRFAASGATTIRVDVDDYVNNLDVELRLINSSGVLLFTADLSTSFDAILTPTLAAGTYFVEVRSDQQSGEMGQYTLRIDTSIGNSAPTRTAAGATLASALEDTIAPAGATVANLFGAVFADSDGTTIAAGGVAIVASAATPEQGKWQVKLGTGAFVDLAALVDSTGVVVLQATDLIRFVPASNYFGIPGSLTARLWDGTGGFTAGAAPQNISSAIGGSGAFSDDANLVMLSTQITGVNDGAPTRIGSGDAVLAAVVEDTTVLPGQSISDLLGGIFADVDGTTIGLGGAAIVANAATPAQGRWQVKLGLGEFIDLPAVVDSTAVAVLRAAWMIRFVPAPNFSGTPGSLTLRLWDGTGSFAATLLPQNISAAIGGSGAFSDNANLVTVSTEVTPVNDAPTRMGAGEAMLAAVLEDTTILPGRSVSTLLGGLFSDVDETTIAAGGAAIVTNGATAETGTWQVKVGAGAFADLPSALDDSGAVVLGAGDLIRFVSALDFNGTPGGLTIRLWDGTGGFLASATAQDISASIGGAGGFADFADQVSLRTIVRAVNDAPIGGDDPLPDIAEDSGERTIALSALLSNDLAGPANESGETLTITAISDVVGGTAQIVGAEVIFMPADDYNGPGGFRYTLLDNGQTNSIDDFLSGAAVVSFMITPTNDAPRAVNDFLASGAEDSVRAIAFAELIGNDSAIESNEDGDFLTIVAVSDAVGGTVAIVGSEVIFTPDDDYSGPAGFGYTLRDNGQTNGQDDFQFDTAIASFTITPVNDAPSGVNDSLPALLEDGGAQPIAFAALVGNDGVGPANENVQTLTVVAVGNAVGGTVEIVAEEVRFTPAENYVGPASFGYTLRDDGQSDGVDDFLTSMAVASFAIDGVNDPPSFAAGLNQTVSDEEFGGSEASVITFGGLSGATGTPLAPYLEDGFRVAPITGRWVQAHISSLANPVPGIYGDTATATLEVTRTAGGFFSFAGFDLASGDSAGPVDPVGYTVEGLRGGQTIFSGTGSVGVKQFVNVDSPSNAVIDTLRFSMLKLNSQAYLLDNIRLVTPPSQVIFGWATMLAVGPAAASDEAGQKLSFSVTNDNNDLFLDPPAVDAFGTLTYSPKPNVRGRAQVTVVIRDSGGADNGGSDASEAAVFLVEVTKELPRHNIVKGLDVTGDGFVVAEDALAVINSLNAFGSREILVESPVGPEFWDTTGDGHVAADDALEVINFLNAFGPDLGQEAADFSEHSLFAEDDSSLDIAAHAWLSDELAVLLAVDAAVQPRRRR